ncbi:MAG: VCBS repeat-containing protein, partial [Planctomycetota bacterium]
DGFLDLFVANGSGSVTPKSNLLYHNNGDGTFTKITDGDIVTDIGGAWSGAWEDFDNDGFLDLFVANLTSWKN